MMERFDVEALRAAIPRVDATSSMPRRPRRRSASCRNGRPPDTNKVAQTPLTVPPEVRTFLTNLREEFAREVSLLQNSPGIQRFTRAW
jgi:hypothetical protein